MGEVWVFIPHDRRVAVECCVFAPSLVEAYPLTTVRGSEKRGSDGSEPAGEQEIHKNSAERRVLT